MKPEAMEPGTLQLGCRDEALLDELRQATFASDSELCRVSPLGTCSTCGRRCLSSRCPAHPGDGETVGRARGTPRLA